MKFHDNSNSKYCKVCGDEARIVNYGALSCQSCKTFFRRNGFHPEFTHPCMYVGQCEVNISTRRVCAPCRLAKCFLVGMTSDRIRKEENTKRSSSSTKMETKYISKLKKLIPLSQLQTLDLLQNDRSLLSTSEWTLLSNVSHAYDRFSLIPTLDYILKKLPMTSEKIYFDTTDVLDVTNCVFTSTRLFVSSTPDFQVLTINEQQSLCERNLFGVSSVSANVFFRDTNFLENPICYNSFIQLYGRETIKGTKYLIKQLDFDSTLFKLMLMIITFSSNCFIVDVHKNIQNDSLIYGTFRLYGSQNVYVELLWKYMLYRYGFNETVIRFSNLVKCVLGRINQAASIYMNHDIFHDYAGELLENTKKTLIINQNEPNSLWGKTLTST